LMMDSQVLWYGVKTFMGFPLPASKEEATVSTCHLKRAWGKVGPMAVVFQTV
jgi:hypothetical protein